MRLIEHVREAGWKPFIVAFSLCVLPLLIACLVAAVIVRDRIADWFRTDLTAEKHKLDGSVTELQHTCTSAASVVTDLKSLQSSMVGLITPAAKGLIDDTKVLEIEQQADGDIYVVVPDLFYENQPKYFGVLLENLVRDNGPTYHYFLPSNCSTAWDELVSKLKERLQTKAVPEPQRRLDRRLQRKFLAPDKFPAPALYGLAIYRSKDLSKKYCVQYCPRDEDIMWNMEIPVAKGDKGEELVNAVIGFLASA